MGCSRNKVFRFYSPDNYVNVKSYLQSNQVKDLKGYYAIKKIIAFETTFSNDEYVFHPDSLKEFIWPKKMYVYVLPRNACNSSSDTGTSRIQPYLDKIIRETLEKNYVESTKLITDTLVYISYIQKGVIHGDEIRYEYYSNECTITFSKHSGW